MSLVELFRSFQNNLETYLRLAKVKPPKHLHNLLEHKTHKGASAANAANVVEPDAGGHTSVAVSNDF